MPADKRIDFITIVTPNFAHFGPAMMALEHGFNVIKSAELFDLFDKKALTADNIKDTLILLPSGELSRARGGAHCMSMPLLRKDV